MKKIVLKFKGVNNLDIRFLSEFLYNLKIYITVLVELIINQIAKPDFLEKYEFINNPLNFEKNETKYLKILKNWFLFNEIKIFENYRKLINKNQRLLFQELFKKGKYNLNREKLLKEIE
ncbi:hypothetical protein [Persephonella sp.]|uniref:hypothetical protein n=1 Tax=Persephonella sp. TaxID=2060922 RepID=UPI0025F32F4C|nr:hypothetical protein [Persephonella sp.]